MIAEQALTQHGGTIGILAVVILLLVKDFVVYKKNGKVACPIVELGSTPMTKEQHDEGCVQKIALVDEKLQHLKEGQGAVKKDVAKILEKLE
jgi:hypothetical protein